VLVVLSLVGCFERSKPGSPLPLQPEQEQPEPHPKPKSVARPHLDPPALKMTPANLLFEMGADGEEQYKGKVVAIFGKVNVDAMKAAPSGGTTTAILAKDDGGPPYAIATLGEESNELLFGPSNLWHPITSVGFHGIYRERDARGTIVLDKAQVMFVGRPGPTPPSTPKTEIAKKDLPKKERDKKDLGKKDEGKKSEPPIVIAPEKLAQELADDIVKNYPRYYNKTLQIRGVIHKRSESKGSIARVDFQAKIKDPKTGKADEWIIFCGLKPPIRSSDALAEGKTVTIRGKLSAAGNGQATLLDCEIVRE
jgi:hypothetical protein